MEEPKYIPSLESNTLEDIDELVMFARERRGVIGLSFSLLLVKALAGVLTEQKRTYKTKKVPIPTLHRTHVISHVSVCFIRNWEFGATFRMLRVQAFRFFFRRNCV